MKRILSFYTVILFGTVSIFAQPAFESLALTPPMGWNSWNTFRLEINEDLVKEVADVFIEKGLRDAGYEFVVIDDGWQIGKDEYKNIME